MTDLRVGPYTLKPIPTGIFGLDGGAMFGTVPKVLWEKANPADDHNRISMEARALLLDGGPGKRVLIDCGIGADFTAKYGEKLGPKFAEMYNVTGGSGVEKSLQNLGLNTSDINTVILTHLHFDHAGGSTREENGRLVPTFANAKYFIQKANLETAQKPNIRERASYYAANFQPLLDAGVLTVLDGPVENLLEFVSVEVSNGHTTGQQIVRISDSQTTVVYCADLIPMASHLNLAWIMGYDLQPLVIIEEKTRLLERAKSGKWLLFMEHEPPAGPWLVQAGQSN
jgi:glyoxylase-like metal-dependent hydrolase (beta-lactamase superfamily II)